VQQCYLDGMAEDESVPLSLQGGPGGGQEADGRQEEVRDVLPITTRAVPAPVVIDLDSMITSLDSERAARRGDR
jgi:hypothetical protein